MRRRLIEGQPICAHHPPRPILLDLGREDRDTEAGNGLRRVRLLNLLR